MLGAIADGSSVSMAMLVGAIVCAIAAPLYIPAWRAERRRRAEAGALVDPTVVSDSAV